MRHRLASPACLGLLAILAACGEQTTAPGVALRGSVSDPAGDTVMLPVIRNGVGLTPAVPVPSDLVAAFVMVQDGALNAALMFAPGTLSRSDTFACLMLDVDENPATGSPGPGGDVPAGYDYSVCAVLPRGSATAGISRLSAVGPAVAVGSVPATFPTDDSVTFSVPLAEIGGASGRLALKVNAMQWVDAPIVNTGAMDWMPDIGLAPVVVR